MHFSLNVKTKDKIGEF